MQVSKFNQAKINEIDFPMRRERYLSTWKIFRSISDENLITAKHIVSLESWKNISSVLDLGCGDGLIAKGIILNAPEQVDSMVLIDPDKEMLEEAYLHLTEVGVVDTVVKNLSRFEESLHFYIGQADVVLAVHLVYLIPFESFKLLIDSLPVGKKLILVLDDENSVFTKLWQHTAPKYVKRSAAVREYLGNLSENFTVKKTVITSKIINPLQQRSDIKDALLSLMSYSDYSQMNTSDRDFVDTSISNNMTGRFIFCASACFEIIKDR